MNEKTIMDLFNEHYKDLRDYSLDPEKPLDFSNEKMVAIVAINFFSDFLREAKKNQDMADLGQKCRMLAAVASGIAKTETPERFLQKIKQGVQMVKKIRESKD